MVRLEALAGAGERDHALVKRLLENHVFYTNSSKARRILANWEKSLAHFVKVIPEAYAEVLARHLAEGKDVRLTLPPSAEELRAA
jgi:glutamate synthase domain-containing protein 3